MGFPKDFQPNNGIEVHELWCSYMWSDGPLVYIYPKPGIEHNVNAAKEQTKLFYKKIVDEKKQYALICDTRDTNPIDKECRDFYSSDAATHNVSAFSFLVDSKFSMVIANFFLGLTTLPFKVKMFTSASHAVSWSKNHIAP
ncbi:MAG TPA: hypothetical protein EYN51_01495 [Flavobacteriales bacterium]|nr:hypothetical protein [Flavobacteriales bacterium]HIA12640.1 hypothetical protein [Flavobacteriales bacterium]